MPVKTPPPAVGALLVMFTAFVPKPVLIVETVVELVLRTLTVSPPEPSEIFNAAKPL